MPLKPFQENYWNLGDTTAPAAATGGVGGYPAWQASVVGSLWGALWDYANTYRQRLVWWWRTYRQLAHLSDGLRAGVWDALEDLKAGPHAEPAPSVQIVTVPVVVDKPARIKKRPRVTSLVQWARRITKLDPAKRAVLTDTLDWLEDARFPLALSAVDRTAHTLGFTRPEAWLPYARMLKGNPGRAENVFRRVQAGEWTREAAKAQGSTLSNADTALLVELAYHVYAKR